MWSLTLYNKVPFVKTIIKNMQISKYFNSSICINVNVFWMNMDFLRHKAQRFKTWGVLLGIVHLNRHSLLPFLNVKHKMKILREIFWSQLTLKIWTKTYLLNISFVCEEIKSFVSSQDELFWAKFQWLWNKLLKQCKGRVKKYQAIVLQWENSSIFQLKE